MRKNIYWFILSEILNIFVVPHIYAEILANKNQTIVPANNHNDMFLQRSKRYLAFEKGASVTIQGNIAKAIIMPSPRGLNMITEYTLNYELPTKLNLLHTKTEKPSKQPVSTTTTNDFFYPYHVTIPYSHDYSQYFNSHMKPFKRIYVPESATPSKCFRQSIYETYKRKSKKLCLRRFKRYEQESVNLTKLPVSLRMFYDLIEKWSQLHGFLPRYCFMRTLCESSQLLLPYGHSLLHDIIHIFLRYTKPWAFHHKIFGRSLRQRYSIDECAKLYGPYCRISWLNYFTNAVYGLY